MKKFKTNVLALWVINKHLKYHNMLNVKGAKILIFIATMLVQ